MRLSWQEIRTRAKRFSERWADAHYEKGETQSFYNEFFDIFGVDRKRVAVFERKIEMIDRNKRGFIDLFWPSVLLVEQKSAGKDLLRAEGQALDYVLGLKDRDTPKFVLTCDFQRFKLLELETRKEVSFTLPQLHKHVEEFGFKRWFRKFLGGDEFINGFYRWILYLADASPSDLRALPLVADKVRQLREYRASSNRASTIALSQFPTRLGVDERLATNYLVIPNTSSERRQFVPIGWLTPDAVANQKLRILPDATPWEFGILTSSMHMAWMRAITGRMKSDYMYSVGVVYNTFPWPEASPAQHEQIGADRNGA